MVSKTDDIPASVPNCNPADPADGAQDGKGAGKAPLKESCGCGKSAADTTALIVHAESTDIQHD